MIKNYDINHENYKIIIFTAVDTRLTMTQNELFFFHHVIVVINSTIRTRRGWYEAARVSFMSYRLRLFAHPSTTTSTLIILYWRLCRPAYITRDSIAQSLVHKRAQWRRHTYRWCDGRVTLTRHSMRFMISNSQTSWRSRLVGKNTLYLHCDCCDAAPIISLKRASHVVQRADFPGPASCSPRGNRPENFFPRSVVAIGAITAHCLRWRVTGVNGSNEWIQSRAFDYTAWFTHTHNI